MKKGIAILLVASALFGSCSQSPQKKAEKVIDKYLQNNLNDYKSYQCVEIGKLKPVTVRDFFVIGLMKKCKDEHGSDMDWLNERLIKLDEHLKSENLKSDSLISYRIDHKYRAKNAMGGYILGKYRYTLNKELTNITEVEELK